MRFLHFFCLRKFGTFGFPIAKWRWKGVGGGGEVENSSKFVEEYGYQYLSAPSIPLSLHFFLLLLLLHILLFIIILSPLTRFWTFGVWNHRENTKYEAGWIKTRPDTRPPVADGWAGAEMRVFPLFHSSVTDRPTNQPTDRRTKPLIELRVRN